ncbi:MAG: DNA-binding protein [Nitrospirae bacterium RIFOXYB2_FULL_43_5]|nr:MAG: DNA-binding protein [Nitrospirae bacterium GWF2_44_13]OGW64958.1 MAG: DNA-binding protein [Nitrospirae bacterium RIFOXYA2_FULL_44_9]OGW80116.1 MAG: DNA-binding protein [Nitrospirae bacterium RIFOXYB2_FULL_43_5]HBG92816.1 DNA-binding protein [Nitrospiraceae bacterium]
MRTKKIIGLVLALSLVLAASLAFAQPMRGGMKGWKGSGGWGMGTQYQRMYNPKTVETITGTVESVDKITPMKGMNYGVHITVKTDKEAISVHLGPGWYIERLDTNIEKGDKVEVKGSRVTFAGKLAIIAAEVKKGDNVLTLRDSTGIPVWSGWRR